MQGGLTMDENNIKKFIELLNHTIILKLTKK